MGLGYFGLYGYDLDVFAVAATVTWGIVDLCLAMSVFYAVATSFKIILS